MKKFPFVLRANTQILEEASGWFVEVSEGELDAGARAGFNRWLRSSPEHVRAYLEAAAIWENAALIDKAKQYDADALLRMTSSGANVVFLEQAGKWGALSRKIGRAEMKLSSGRVAMAASVAAVLAGLLAWLGLAGSPGYSTDVGEQHSIVLADGSTVTLNSSSRIRVDFTAGRRGIELSQGQALFDVARDPTRPFVVRSGNAQVTAVGTRFDIDRRQRGTVVTVVEGRVAVLAPDDIPSHTGEAAPRKPSAPSTLLSAGERVTVTARASSPIRVNLAAATAWTQRRLVFSSTPLNEVAEEYNRYHKRRLSIRDRELESLNISGTFSATDAASLIDFLREQPGVQVREAPSEIEITAPPPPDAGK